MSFWDHIANPSKRASRSEHLKHEQSRIDKLMRLPADTSSASAPPRQVDALPYVYHTEEIKRVEVQRPLDLEDSYIESFPRMAAAITQAHRLRVPYELIY